MRKIPVFRAIARAYGFGFGRFGTAVAICWLPYLLIAAATVFVLAGPAHDLFGQFFSAVAQRVDAAGGGDSKEEAERFFNTILPAYGAFYRYAVLLFLFNMLMQAIVAIGLTRTSMGFEENGFFYFSLDKPVWKLFGAWLATYLIIYAATAVVVFLCIMLGVIIGIGLVQASPIAFAVFCVGLALAALSLIAYVAIRLNFFLPAIIVSEKKLDLLRSWNLSEGNVWRIFGIYLSFIPVLIVLVIAGSLAKLIAVFGCLPQRLTDSADWNVWTGVASDILPWLGPLIAVALLAQILLQAMLYAATARAYRDIVATDIAPQTERE